MFTLLIYLAIGYVISDMKMFKGNDFKPLVVLLWPVFAVICTYFTIKNCVKEFKD